MTDTIFALATAKGKAGVSIVRISGPKVPDLFARFSLGTITPRIAHLREIIYENDLIDQAVVIYFPEGKSFTSEHVLELHLHGSLAIISKILTILSGFEGFRAAEPGEFTRRSFINGVMSLTQIEGLSDLIEAETELQRKQAQKVFSGIIVRKSEEWRHAIVRSLALVESLIDFSDEELPDDLFLQIIESLQQLIKDIESEIDGSFASERLREGFEIALLGPPNAGKSSLLNRLAKRDISITSNIPGTTRDIIEVRMDIMGLPVTILDTAGIRASSDPLEIMGINKTKFRAEKADLRVYLLDPEQKDFQITPQPEDIVLYGKADVYPREGQISAKTGQGVNELLEKIANILESRLSSSAVFTRQRHRQSVMVSIIALKNALEMMGFGEEKLEIVAEELRAAAQGLEVLVGAVGVENLLDEIFSSFCIGK